MKFADLAPSNIDSDQVKRPANEDSPSGAALYKLISRRPSIHIASIAIFVALLIIAAETAYFWGFYNSRDLGSLLPQEWGFLTLAYALPLLLVTATAYLVWRAQEMRLMADALAQTAIRLSDPQEFSADQVASLTQTINAELGRVQRGFEAAIDQASKLNALVATELEAIEKSSVKTETRARDMEELLGRHKAGLEVIAETLGRESETVAKSVQESADIVRAITGEAEETLQAASAAVMQQTETLARVSEAARAGADATTTMLDRQSSRLEVVATNALNKADAIGQRYETQRELIAEAADRLENEHKRLDAIFTMHRDDMQKADAAMAARSNEISNAAAELAVRLEATFEGATARAADLRHSIKVEVAQAANEIEQVSGAVSRGAGAAARAIGATIDELKSASTVLNEDVTRLASTLADDVNKRISELRDMIGASADDNDKAAERFNAAMIRLGGAAREAGRHMRDATDDVAARMAELPAEAVQSAGALKAALEEHISALASIAEIVVSHSRTLDRSNRNEEPKAIPSLPPFSARPAEPARDQQRPLTMAEQREAANRRWGIPDLLAAAGRDAQPRQAQSSDSDFQRGALHIIETLQALSIDLNRALENSPPPELWRRYQAGERNVFARRLYGMAGRELYDRIAARHRTDSEFREQVDHFIQMFERLLVESSGRDRENILVETYLTSDTGKVYLMLAQATGKLG